MQGEHGQALDCAARAISAAAFLPYVKIFALALQGRAQLALGRAEESLRTTEEGLRLLQTLGASEEGDSLLRLTHYEALRATGQDDAAMARIAEARDLVLARAADIEEPSWRQSFLERVFENHRILELARTL